MRIENLIIKHSLTAGDKTKTIGLNCDVNILYSKEENSTGKTTLMRSILYTLGFAIPNTELVKFEDFEFTLTLINGEKTHKIIRKKQLLTIDEFEYDLPIDEQSAHAYLFGTGNNELLYNLLGTIYFDQEKGWTLLNRGTIIGENRFKIESFFRGLKGDESDDSYRIVARISALDRKIKQYKLMLNVAEYQESISRDVAQNIDYKTYEQRIDEERLALQQQLDNINSEITLMKEIIKKNKDFSAFLLSKRLFVRDPNGGEPIRVTSETLVDFKDLHDVNQARVAVLTAERNRLKREIAEREKEDDSQFSLFDDLPTADEELTRRIASIQGLNSVQIQSMIDAFDKERKELKERLKNRTKQDNTWVYEAYKIIGGYAKELNIPFDYKIDIFTSNLKEKSGAILHKMVFIYKLAYIKLLSQKLGYKLPIFCDSPSGREVKKTTIDSMLGLIKRDFSDHQLIIASIYKYESVFPNANIIEMNGTLFNRPSLLDGE